MPKSVCFLGYGHLGSWKVRGEQVASQRPHWSASTELTPELLRDHDIFCIVKHLEKKWRKPLERSGKIAVLDVVDGWSQPDDNLRVASREDALRLFAERWRRWRFIEAHIFPTRAMQEDLRELTSRSTVIYHHFRPGTRPGPVRELVRTLGYEGAPEYLAHWRGAMERFCSERGLSFVVNPESLCSLDIGFAARGAQHDSYLTRRYKSNVKLANLCASGTPCVLQRGQSGYHETDCGAVEYFSDERELYAVLDALIGDYPKRRTIHDELIRASSAFALPAIADQYEAFFESLDGRDRRRRFWGPWTRGPADPAAEPGPG